VSYLLVDNIMICTSTKMDRITAVDVYLPVALARRG
jgi:hypothetical protein